MPDVILLISHEPLILVPSWLLAHLRVFGWGSLSDGFTLLAESATCSEKIQTNTTNSQWLQLHELYGLWPHDSLPGQAEAPHHGSRPHLASVPSRLPAQVRIYLVSTSGYDVDCQTVQVKKYTKDHEWIELSDDKKTGVIGISEYAAHALGDVVYVELPTTPMEVAAGDSIGAVESVKSASDINSPISCTITDVNDLLEEKPGSINNGAEDIGAGGGWVAKVEVGEAGVKDLDGLMDAAAYKEFTEE
jgi:glycine cleavage system H protein